MYEPLASLRDLQGILGSFVLDAEGQLCARDMPGWFDDTALREAGARLASIRAGIASLAPESSFDGATARFGEHLLVMRAVGTGSLCVLCPTNVDKRALQMSVSLVARRLYASAVRASEPPPPPRDSQPPAPPAQAEAAPPQRWFRGRPVA